MIHETKKILEFITENHEEGNCYYVLNGSDNKVWLLPLADVCRGLEIYSASSLRGIILKKLLPWMIKIPFIRRFLAIGKINLSIKQDMRRVIEEISPEPLLSMYLGDTRYPQNRKIIIQIFNKSKVLG